MKAIHFYIIWETTETKKYPQNISIDEEQKLSNTRKVNIKSEVLPRTGQEDPGQE